MKVAVKISKPQQELLDAIGAGVKVSFSPYMGRFNPRDYYWRWDTSAKVTTAARGLLEKGIVEKFNESWRGHYLRLKK